MSDNDGREIAANIFDKTAKAATALAATLPAPANVALGIAAGIASAVAGLLRSLGVEDAKQAIDELVRDKNKGVITDEHVARDNATIADAVAGLYAEDDGETGGDEE